MSAETVEFKSAGENYLKEKTGIKNNTWREVDEDDERFAILREWARTKQYGNIRIRFASDLKQFFERPVRDVTFFKTGVIITWDVYHGRTVF